MQGKKEISIIVPVYNVEKYLGQCIESVLDQTFSDFELILIDDGSNDRSVEICDKYANKDSRIRVIHKANEGVGVARNIGLDLCEGRFICFLDSDDYLEKDYLEYLYSKIEDSDYDFVSCTANFVDENGKFIACNDYELNELEINKGNVFDIYMKSNMIEDAVWNKIYRREIFKDLRYVEGLIYEDSEIIIRLLKRINKALFTKAYKYNYRIRQGSILNYQDSNIENKKFNIKKIDLLTVYVLILRELKDTQYEQFYVRQILFTCSKLWSDSRISTTEEKKKSRKVIKKYYKNYKKYLFHRGMFSLKEKCYIILNIYIGDLLFRGKD